MNLSALFNTLGAPLHNNRWSWGAIRKEDCAVYFGLNLESGLRYNLQSMSFRNFRRVIEAESLLRVRRD